jgi:ubiquinone/menaquinone biosynthesis C-methylase UbiE
MGKHVCPWYLGYFLINPARRFVQNPETILRPYVKKGMRVLEVGPGMGFFSLPIARLVGETGRVFTVDLQKKMLDRLERRAVKAGLSSRLEIRLCSESSLQLEDLSGSIDFALTFAVVHEVQDQKHLFRQVSEALNKGGLLLVSEPEGHVKKTEFEATLSLAKDFGMKIIDEPKIWRSHSSVLEKC